MGPIPSRFLLLPIAAPEMSVSISTEMNQVTRAGPPAVEEEEGGAGIRAQGKARAAGGEGGRRGAPAWARGEDAPSCPRRAGPALPALPWLPGRAGSRGRAPAASESARAEQAGREGPEVFPRGCPGPGSGLEGLSEGGRGNLGSRCQGLMPSV